MTQPPTTPGQICALSSPNFNDRAPGSPLRYVILHYTGMESKEAALARLCTKDSDVSAHYLIDEDGQIYQMVAEDRRAWHAGKSFWRGERDMNSASIGIELVNPGHAFGYRPFPAAQIAALCGLLADIKTRHNLARDAFWGHADIAPLRKEDPGELFPWQDLAALGFGLWPPHDNLDPRPAQQGEIDALLRAIGYESAADNPGLMEAALRAFQRHFRPHDVSGTADDETTALLRACALPG